MGLARSAHYTIVFLLTLAAARAQSTPAADPLAARDRAIHAANRLTFGVRPGLIAEIERVGFDAWLERQLQATRPQAELARKMQALGSAELTTHEIFAAYALEPGQNETPEQQRAREALALRPKMELQAAVLWRAIESDAQVAEVMSDFWRNHFNIDMNKDSIGYSPIEFDRVVIRQHVFGSFHDMLAASARHPAMLIYLDNFLSRRPPSATELKAVARNVRRETGSRERGDEAQRIAEQNGLNENYARELLELHTLGVDNGYTQKDVVAVAEALTGWTVDTAGRRYVFSYQEDMHAEGDKFVLGKSIIREKRRDGVEEGEAVIAMLASHPSTADFIARKLCVYLVADEPPSGLVERVARELRRTKLDLRQAVRFIAHQDEFWDPRCVRSKFRTPFEFIAAATRACGADVADPTVLVRAAEQMGQPIYCCEDPTGYRDTAESWRDPGVMAARWRFALALAANRIPGVFVHDTFFAGIAGRPVPAMIDALARRTVPGGLRAATIVALMRIAAEQARTLEVAASRPAALRGPAPVELERRLLGVILGSPEFQEQ
jgi:uncharacterized protein (DUF1800 family)